MKFLLQGFSYFFQNFSHYNRITFYLIIASQVIALIYQILKANYDSVLLNGAAFSAYSGMVCYRLVQRLLSLEIAQEKGDHKHLWGLITGILISNLML